MSGNDKRTVIVALVLLFLFLLSFFAFPFGAWADAGGFAGSSSFGGGGYSGGYSGGGYTGGGYGGYYGGYTGGGGYSGGGDIIGTFIFWTIVLVIIFLISQKRNNSKGGRNMTNYDAGGNQPAGASRTPDSQLQDFSSLMARDPAFKPSELEQEVANLYVRMQQAWTAKDFEPMRPYFSNQLYSQFANQLAAIKAAGQTNYVNNIAVLEVTARGWYTAKNAEYVVLKVRTRITDFTLDDRTGALVGGVRNGESFMEYEYVLARPAGTKTNVATKNIMAGQCPHCGAPINRAQSAKCEYCGSVVEQAAHDWVIVAIRGISQQINRF